MTVEIHLWAAPVAERLRALDQLIAVSGVGSSPALATCETRQVLIAGVPGGFSRGSPVFAYILIGPSHMSRNNLERDVKLKKNYERNVPDLKSISASLHVFCLLYLSQCNIQLYFRHQNEKMHFKNCNVFY